MSDEDRTLGHEMLADGWRLIGGEWIFWLHEPSRRSVDMHDAKWSARGGVPALHGSPAEGADGYVVIARTFDEDGNPDTLLQAFWTDSYGIALRHARRMRAAILAERPMSVQSEQLTLDALGGDHAPR